MIRSILAVLAGLVTLTVASFGIEAVVNSLVHSPDSLPVRLLTMAYTLASVAAGGYVTAWVARGAGVRHAVAMGIIEALMTLDLWLSGIAPGNSPVWQWIIGIALLVPAAWWGGSLCASRGNRS